MDIADLGEFLASRREAGQTGFSAKAPPGQIHSFKDLMMPALVRVGAVTDRSRKLFEEAGIPVFSDTRVLEKLEDAGTGELEMSRLDN